MPATNPYQQYKEQAIMTMTPGELVVQLFEGCSKKLNTAVYHIENGNTEKAEEELYKAQRIINYLDASLDRRIDISSNLPSDAKSATRSDKGGVEFSVKTTASSINSGDKSSIGEAAVSGILNCTVSTVLCLSSL